MKRTNRAKQAAVLFVWLLGILYHANTQAQVVVGGDEPLQNYTILQLEGIGGLRLPKMTTANRDNNLTPLLGNNESAGLMIYNETDDCIEFWDGTMWNPLKKYPALNNSKNGVTGNGTASSQFKLGGSITSGEPVTINQNNKNLFFDVTTGKFTVSGSNAFVVTADGVGVGTGTPGAALDIVASSAGTGFRYNTADSPAVNGHALTSDKDGNAIWKEIRIDPIRREASMIGGVQITSTTLNNAQKISNNLTLTKGMWLISARYVATTPTGQTASNSLGYNAWLRLRDVNAGTDENCVGMVPQYQNSQLLATPQLSFVVQVPDAGKTYAIYADAYQSSSSAGAQMQTYIGSIEYGDAYFYAVQLSDVIY
jgi:hypothetical protein